ncbi:MAG: hypothetical protein IID42_12460 [Planctomycetes bacterium]|nr:hypothetical protein [Planctomycetota bacterium]
MGDILVGPVIIIRSPCRKLLQNGAIGLHKLGRPLSFSFHRWIRVGGRIISQARRFPDLNSVGWKDWGSARRADGVRDPAMLKGWIEAPKSRS